MDDRQSELAAQLDYLRRMSRYDNDTDQDTAIQALFYTRRSSAGDEEPAAGETPVRPERRTTMDDLHPAPMAVRRSSIDESFDDLPAKISTFVSHDAELDRLSFQHGRRTASEITLLNASSLIPKHEQHASSTACLLDTDDETLADDTYEVYSSLPAMAESRPVGHADRHETESSSTQQHFQSAYDLHDEEKSKLVRSPELYNIDNGSHIDHRSLTSSQIQYRTQSESALTMDDGKRSNIMTESNETSDEFLTIISNEDSLESMQSHRHSTPYADVMEKESSPEHSESYNIPPTAFSDTLEPTSSCRRPLAFAGTDHSAHDHEMDLSRAANELVEQVIHDVVTELNSEQDESSFTSNDAKLSSRSSSSNDDDDKLLEEDEDEYEQHQLVTERVVAKQPMEEETPVSSTVDSRRTFTKKVLRRAQTDARDFDIEPTVTSLAPPVARRSSQSDTEAYFRAVSPSINEYSSLQHDLIESLTLDDDDDDDDAHSQDEEEDFDDLCIWKTLQEGILRQNLESSHNAHTPTFLGDDHSTSATRRGSSDTCIDVHVSDVDQPVPHTFHEQYTHSIAHDVKALLDELIEAMHDELSVSISSEPLSSQSDATTVIFNSTKHSIDDDDHLTRFHTPRYDTSSSHSLFDTSNSRTPSSIPTFSETQLLDHDTQRKFHSHPGSFDGSHISLSTITSITDDRYPLATTPSLSASGN